MRRVLKLETMDRTVVRLQELVQLNSLLFYDGVELGPSEAFVFFRNLILKLGMTFSPDNDGGKVTFHSTNPAAMCKIKEESAQLT